ncbi:ras GEF [Coprinopsis marcescibilis]|uniref:Ras GEF n=1 Tax=Coprinopsis marcescibilis TaxID=230819 RepID=A0A5C3L5M7_COPMA|nr:ras GEF [Coprinopsis marcescibilis]
MSTFIRKPIRRIVNPHLTDISYLPQANLLSPIPPFPPVSSSPSVMEDDAQSDSVRTSDALPSGSMENLSSCLTLKFAFPSIYTSMRIMERACADEDLSALQAVGSTLHCAFRTALEEIDRFPRIDGEQDITLSKRVTNTFFSVFSDQLRSIASPVDVEQPSSSQPTSPGKPDPEPIMLTLRAAQMVLFKLEDLYNLTYTTSREKKALPALPIEEPVAPASRRITQTVASTSTHGRTLSAGTVAFSSSSETAFSSINELESNEERDRVIARKGPQKISMSSKFKDKVHSFSMKNKSNSVLSGIHGVGGPDAVPGYLTTVDVLEGENRKYMPYRPRHSAIHIEGDTFSVLELVERPTSVAYDARGQLKAGTINSIIKLITSSEGIANGELLNMVFESFRMFLSPEVFLDALMQRFQETGPESNDAQLERLWRREVRSTRSRIVRLLAYWLEYRWDPGKDSCVLEDIKLLVTNTFVIGEVSADTLALLSQRIERVERGSFSPPIIAASATKIRLPGLRKFRIPKHSSRDVTTQLLAYDSGKGRKQFAKQTTATISEMFLKVDPSDMVDYWSMSEQKKREMETEGLTATMQNVLAIRDFEESMAMWVTYTILKQHDRQQRVPMIAFWLDVAMNCMELRNFSSACCIFSGVAHCSIGNMKETVVCVPKDSKGQFHRLDRLFTFEHNYKEARSVMEDKTKPTVPLTAPLKHDVAVTLEIPKTSTKEKTLKDGAVVQVDMHNLSGYRIMAKTIKSLDFRVPYNIEKAPDFEDWLMDHLGRFQDYENRQDIFNNFYARARKREPRNPVLASIQPWNWITRDKNGSSFNDLIELNAAKLASSATTMSRAAAIAVKPRPF